MVVGIVTRDAGSITIDDEDITLLPLLNEHVKALAIFLKKRLFLDSKRYATILWGS